MSRKNTRGLDGWYNRGWMDIVGNILEICKGGSIKTHVMYRCNLNSDQLKEYLALLGQNGLLDSGAGGGSKGTVYRTTEKGMQYLDAYCRLETLLMSA